MISTHHNGNKIAVESIERRREDQCWVRRNGFGGWRGEIEGKKGGKGGNLLPGTTKQLVVYSWILSMLFRYLFFVA